MDITPPNNIRKTKRIQFKPPLLAVFLTVFGVSLFIGLGKWQLERADDKAELLRQHQQQQMQPMLALPNGDIKNLKQWQYQKVSFTGKPLADRQFLLDNQIRNGKLGLNVMTPFERLNSSLILVDRGWIALKSSRDSLPDVSIDAQPMRVEGTVYVPVGKPFAVGVSDEGSTGWPRLVTHINYAEMSERLGADLPAFTIRMSPELAGDYYREWPLIATSPDKNLAYAVQWFAFALAALIIFLVLNVKVKHR